MTESFNRFQTLRYVLTGRRDPLMVFSKERVDTINARFNAFKTSKPLHDDVSLPKLFYFLFENVYCPAWLGLGLS